MTAEAARLSRQHTTLARSAAAWSRRGRTILSGRHTGRASHSSDPPQISDCGGLRIDRRADARRKRAWTVTRCRRFWIHGDGGCVTSCKPLRGRCAVLASRRPDTGSARVDVPCRHGGRTMLPVSGRLIHSVTAGTAWRDTTRASPRRPPRNAGGSCAQRTRSAPDRPASLQTASARQCCR